MSDTRLRRGLRLLAILLICLLASGARADDVDLAMLSLEELMEIEVALVSRQPERVLDVPAAIHVITAADLRRTGVRSLPEALRLVPGMQVARVDGNKWAVSVRGFNSLFANKLLVLVDGRSVYTPVFSGVFWDAPDVIFDDVERIEVIRGPGGTLWGANAVNGIINIVTREASAAPGTHVRVDAGLHETGGLAVSHGGALSEKTSLRLHTKVFSRRAGDDSTGANLQDDWSALRAGARLESRRGEADRFLVDAGIYRADIGQTLRVVQSLTPPYLFTDPVTSHTEGAHVMGRWDRHLDRDELSLQAYFDYWARNDLPALKGHLYTLDVDLQHRRALGAHHLSWGLGLRRTRDHATKTFTVTFRPKALTQYLISGFAHMDIALGEDVGLAVGSKVEHNGHTGIELQPSTRLWWRPGQDHLLWGSVSRAVRTPARADDDLEAAAQVTLTQISADSSLPTLITQLGDRRLRAENLLAFEAGYRATVRHDLLADIAVFYNRYNDLRTSEPEFPILRTLASMPTHLYLPLRAASRGGGTTAGVEISSRWQLSSALRLSSGYAFLHMDLNIDADSADELFLTQEEESPNHTAHLRLQADLTPGTELDIVTRYVGGLPAQGIGSYLTADARWGWHPSEDVEIALGGRHLLDAPHREFSPQVAANLPGRVAADLYTTLTWRF